MITQYLGKKRQQDPVIFFPCNSTLKENPRPGCRKVSRLTFSPFPAKGWVGSWDHPADHGGTQGCTAPKISRLSKLSPLGQILVLLTRSLFNEKRHKCLKFHHGFRIQRQEGKKKKISLQTTSFRNIKSSYVEQQSTRWVSREQDLRISQTVLDAKQLERGQCGWCTV